MKMKSAMTKEKELEEEYNAITVKTEWDSEQQSSSTEEDEDSNEEQAADGFDLNVLIKEEPHLLEISEDYCEDTSSCLDTDGFHPEGDVKVESDSDGAAVKEEAESWFKEERGSEDGEEEEDLRNIQEEFEEGEGVCTGIGM